MFVLIHKDDLDEYWPEIERHIRMITPYWGGEMSIEDIYQFSKEDRITWAVSDKACFSMEVIDYPQKTILNIPHVAGRDVKEWKDECLSIANDFAKRVGATEIRTAGRKGWEKILPDFNHEYTVLSREVL